MNQRRQTRVARLGMVASIATAFGASLCCIGPIIAVMFGLTSLAAFAKYEALRPIFGGVTVVLLAGAFYATYRRPLEVVCEPGSACATPGPDRMQKINRVAVWIAAVVAAVVFAFPTWSGWMLG